MAINIANNDNGQIIIEESTLGFINGIIQGTSFNYEEVETWDYRNQDEEILIIKKHFRFNHDREDVFEVPISYYQISDQIANDVRTILNSLCVLRFLLHYDNSVLDEDKILIRELLPDDNSNY